MRYFKNIDSSDTNVYAVEDSESGFFDNDEFVEIDEVEANEMAERNNAPPPPTLEQQRQAAMQTGVEFEGVMCSGFKEDQWGLASVKDFIMAGNDVDFWFRNGNTLTLTSTNLPDFESVWIPFRQAHTKPNFTGS